MCRETFASRNKEVACRVQRDQVRPLHPLSLADQKIARVEDRDTRSSTLTPTQSKGEAKGTRWNRDRMANGGAAEMISIQEYGFEAKKEALHRALKRNLGLQVQGKGFLRRGSGHAVVQSIFERII